MNKHTLLFSGGINNFNNYKRYENDLNLMYDVFTSSFNYDKNNIQILYNNGTSIIKQGTILNINKADKNNFYKYLLDLSNKVEKDDIFVFAVTNHGASDGSICTYMTGQNNWISQTEVENLINVLKCIKIIIMGQCFGGNYVSSGKIKNSIIISANEPNKESYARSIVYNNKYIAGDYDEFIYHFFSYYNGTYPSGQKLYEDSKDKTVIKAFEYAKKYDSYSIANAHPSGCIEQPSICNNLDNNQLIGTLSF